MAYLDHAATTPLRPEAAEAMAPYWSEHLGNPSGSHAPAREARKAVDEARDEIADLLGAEPGEVVFTGGGTEADNLAIFGPQPGSKVICSGIEHHAVLDPVAALDGATVPVDAAGTVDLEALESMLSTETKLVSIMLANNETGAIQPFDDISRIVHRAAPGAYLHTDAVQAFSWLDVKAMTAGADLISISGHKFGGPKGAGALVVRNHVDLQPMFLGGGQERGLRSGTHNVTGIVGMAAAARVAASTRDALVERASFFRDQLLDRLLMAIPKSHETGGNDRFKRTAGIVNLCFQDIESESLLYLLEQGGVSASAASSCSSGAMEPSHVLAAMGIERVLAAGSLRLSLGYSTTADDVDQALSVIPPAVERLRLFS